MNEFTKWTHFIAGIINIKITYKSSWIHLPQQHSSHHIFIKRAKSNTTQVSTDVSSRSPLAFFCFGRMLEVAFLLELPSASRLSWPSLLPSQQPFEAFHLLCKPSLEPFHQLCKPSHLPCVSVPLLFLFFFNSPGFAFPFPLLLVASDLPSFSKKQQQIFTAG